MKLFFLCYLLYTLLYMYLFSQHNLRFLEYLLSLLDVLTLWKLILKGVILIDRFAVALLLLLFYTVVGQFILGLENQDREFFAHVGIRIILQGILSRDDARLVVVTQIVAQIVVESGRKILFQYQLILQLESHLLCFTLQMALREIFKEHLQLLNGCVGGRLVQARLRGIQIECLSGMKASQLSIGTMGIDLIILDKGLGSRLIVLHVVVTHTQHIERLLSLICTLHNRDEFVQQDGCTTVLSLSKIGFGRLVLIFVVCTLQELVVLAA